jgi:hypothetical protein
MSFQVLRVPPTSTNNVVQDTRELPGESTTPISLPAGEIDEIEGFAHNMNYYVLIVFHTDVDMRPCNPVLRVISLPQAPDTLQHQLLSNPRGLPIHVTCQLCDACVNTKEEFSIDMFRLLSVYALNITDVEAIKFMNNVAKVNTSVSTNQTTLTQRSNIALVPRFFHRSVQLGVRSINEILTAHSLTDVQMCTILLRESLNPARSVSVKLRALHPYLATPENLQDALTIFTRSLDNAAFKADAFKFAVL